MALGQHRRLRKHRTVQIHQYPLLQRQSVAVGADHLAVLRQRLPVLRVVLVAAAEILAVLVIRAVQEHQVKVMRVGRVINLAHTQAVVAVARVVSVAQALALLVVRVVLVRQAA